ncbi:MAG: oligosaccharide flippase family protein [Desulfobacterales bacterium]
MTGVSFPRMGNAIYWQMIQHVGVKAIFVIRLMVLAWLLSPDDFGLLAIAGICVDVMMRITNFGMVPALVQRSTADEDHYRVAWTIGMMRALSVACVIIIAAPAAARIFAEPRATNLILVLALRPILDAGASIHIARLIRDLHFRSPALLHVTKAVANTAVAVLSAQWLGAWALVAGALAGSGAFLIGSYFAAPFRPRFCLNKPAARSLIRFGKWIFFAGLVAIAGQTVLRLLIARRLGAAELGLYYLAAGLAFLPSDVAGQVVGQVAFPFYARMQSDLERLSVAFRSILTGLSAILVPACILLIALAPSLVENLLGPDWKGTTSIIQVLALSSMIGLFGDTMVPILHGTGRPDHNMVLEAVQSFLLIVMAWLLTGTYGVMGAAVAWLPATGTTQIIGVIMLRAMLPQPFADLAKPLTAIAFVSVFAAGTAVGVERMIPGPIGVISAGVLGMAVTGWLFWCIERRFRVGLSDGLVQAFPYMASFVGLPNRQAI